MLAMQRPKFKLLVHKADGQKYEDLFVKIITYSESGFKVVKPHGSLGDRGNDGWVSCNGRYYQCYASEALPSNTEKAIKKMKGDFATLKKYWERISPVKEFFFVLNDKFHGVPALIYTAIAELKASHGLRHAEVYVASQLEKKLFSLLGTDIGFERAISELVNRVGALTEHFTDSDDAALTPDHKWWRQDKSWKRTWRTMDVYQQMSAESESWRTDLFKIHCNMV